MADPQMNPADLMRQAYDKVDDPKQKAYIAENAKNRFGIDLLAPPTQGTPGGGLGDVGDALGSIIGGAPGFAQEMYRQNVQPLVQAGQALGNQPPTTNVWESLLNSVAGPATPLARGMLGGAYQAIKGGDVNAIPVAGQAIEGGKAYLAGDPAKGNADELSALFSAVGPEILKGIGAPIRAGGQKLIEESFPWKGESLSKIPVEDRAGIAKYIGDNQITSTDQLNDMIKQGMNARDQLVQQAGDPMVKGGNAISPMLREIQSRLKSNLPESNMGQIEDHLKEYLDSYDRSMPTSEMLEHQKETYRQLQGKGAYGDVHDPKLQDEILSNKLLARGQKQVTSGAVPGISDISEDVSKMMTIREGLEYLEKTQPSYFKKILPWVAGTATAGTMLATGLGHGINGLLLPMGATGATAYLARTAMQSPSIAMRLGVAMSHAGLGKFGKALVAGSRIAQLGDRSDQSSQQAGSK